VPTNKDMRMK